MRKLTKTIPLLLSSLFILSLSSLNVSAAVNYTNTSGSVKVVCGDYKKTFNAKNYYNNFSYTLNTALETAGKKASADTPARVTVTKGYYKLDRTIKVYSNTVLDATGSYFRYYGNMLRNGFDGGAAEGYGYTSASNITVKGGEWEQLIDFKYAGSSDTAKMHTNFRFAHVTGLTVKKATFKNNYNCHDIELAGVKKARVYGNYFYNDKSVNGIENDGGRESVQIDVNTSEAMPVFPAYDKTPCDDIAVYNNRFKNKFRAVGSHHAVLGKTYNNVRVHHNIMENIGGIAVYAVYWTNCKIYSNVMYNVGMGVDMRGMINTEIYNFKNLDDISWEQAHEVLKNSKAYIYDNDILVRAEKNTFTRECGVRVLGDKFETDDAVWGVKAGVYPVYNVNIGVDSKGSACPNLIYGNVAVGVHMNYGRNSRIAYNYINLKDSVADTANGIEVKGCLSTTVESNSIYNGLNSTSKGIYLTPTGKGDRDSSLTVSNNRIDNFKLAGVYVHKASDTVVSGNTVINCNENALTVSAGSALTARMNVLSSLGYGAYICDSSSDIVLDGNSIINPSSGVYALKSSNVMLLNNEIVSKNNGILAKNVSPLVIENNSLNSRAYGIRLGNDCADTAVNGNSVTSADECLYFNGSSSADKTEAKTLVVTDNVLNCPKSAAGVRVVYDNVSAVIHSNTRPDSGQPTYRFKGDGEASYSYLRQEIALSALNVETADGIDDLSWTAEGNPQSFAVFAGGRNAANVQEYSCSLPAAADTEYTVTPKNTYGNITVSGKSLSVTNNK